MKAIRKVFLMLILCFTTLPLFAVNTYVQKVSGAGSLTATIQTADGGYVTTSQIDATTFLVRRAALSGHKRWERTLNLKNETGFLNNEARINAIAETTDGGFVLAGAVRCDYQCWDNGSLMLLKLRSNGTLAWKKSFAVNGVGSAVFSSVTPTSDGGVIAIGAVLSETNRFLVIRFTRTGKVSWKKTIETLPDRSNPFLPHPITAVKDGFIIAFTTLDSNNRPKNVHLLNVNDSGKILWEKSLTHPGYTFHSVGTTADGGVIVTGSTISPNQLKVFVLKSDGTLRWKGAYSLRVPGAFDSVSSPVQTTDGGYVLTGGIRDLTKAGNVGFVAKIDSSHNVAFQNLFRNAQEDIGKSVLSTPDGGFLLFGGIARGLATDFLVVKLDSQGLVGGCSFLQSLGPTTRSSFGQLNLIDVKKTPSRALPLEAVPFKLSSAASNHPPASVCQ